MAICKWCGREMMAADGCAKGASQIVIDGIQYDPIPYGGGQWGKDYPVAEGRRCHDCNCKRGELHHPGCDMEECPKCHGQLISCGCLDDEDDGYDVITEDDPEIGIYLN